MTHEQNHDISTMIDTAAFLQWKRLSAEVNMEKAAEQINWTEIRLFI